MPTNDERREVARRLRDNAGQKPGWVIPWAAFNDAYEHEGAELLNRLADLIEPEERTCHAVRLEVPFDPRDFPDDLIEVYQFRCSECSVLLEDDWSFCPNCGAKVVQQ